VSRSRISTHVRRSRIAAAGPQQIELLPEVTRLRRGRGGEYVFEWRVPRDALLLVTQLRYVRGDLDGIEAVAVTELRRGGFSWGDLGELFGIDRETARRRWGTVDEAIRAAGVERAGLPLSED
jgi:hypothetical protein